MRVICVNNKRYGDVEGIPLLTIGKEYECIEEKGYDYLILIDDYTRWYSKSRFITKEEIRNQKLGELGI